MKNEILESKKNHANKVVNEIMNNFDFERVHEVMNKLQWTWLDTQVPTIEDLKITAQQLLHNITTDEIIHKDEYMMWATGGFMAQYIPNSISPIIHLFFNITDYSSLDAGI